MFGRVKTGGSLGQVTTKKMENNKKTGITRPRPDGGVKRKTRKAPGALTPPLFSLPLGSKIYYGHVRYKPKWCKF